MDGFIKDMLLAGLIGSIAGGVVGFIIDLLIAINKVLRDTGWVSLVPYTRLVNEIILYTNDILVEKGIKYFPTFSIRYYRHKEYAGLYSGEIVVYLGNNREIPELVNTVLHEVQHYIQSVTDTQYKHYGRFTAERGYWDNPFEKESRAFAAMHRDNCLKYLESKQIIRRE